ncbi:MAG: ribosome-binding factor A [Acidimicrobiales bacterium]
MRVNEALREVLADELERMADIDERLALLTITGVSAEPDLRHCLVMFDSLDEAREAVLQEGRVRLQAAIAHQLRLKRTPQLAFTEDPAVAAGRRIEDVLRGMANEPEASEPGPAPTPDD